MTINGLPLHPLVVHATVVALPVTAVLAVLYVYRANTGSRLNPHEDPGLRVALLVLGPVCAALVFITRASGEDLRNTLGMDASIVHDHQMWADWLAWTTYAFAVVAVVVGLRDQKADWPRGLLHGLLVVGAVAIVVFCVLTGDTGARMVYGTVGQ